jgi:hypothetical protein
MPEMRSSEVALAALSQTLSTKPEWRRRQQDAHAVQPLPKRERDLQQDAHRNARRSVLEAGQTGVVASDRRGEPVRLEDCMVQAVAVPGQAHLCLVDDRSRAITPCQDQVACRRSSRGGVLVCALADGATSAPLSHFGAMFLSQAACEIAAELAEEKPDELLSARFLGELYHRLYLRGHDLSRAARLSHSDAYELFLAAALTVLVITPENSLILAIADGYLRLQGEVRDLHDLVCRDTVLRNQAVPPLLWHRLALDHELGATRREMAARESDVLALGRELDALTKKRFISRDSRQAGAEAIAGESAALHIGMDRLDAIYDECGRFKVAWYGPTRDLLSGDGVALFSDGLYYAQPAETRGKNELKQFPAMRLISTVAPADLESLLSLWNLVAEPLRQDSSSSQPITGTLCPIGAVLQLLKTGPEEVSGLLAEAVKEVSARRAKEDAGFFVRTGIPAENASPLSLLEELLSARPECHQDKVSVSMEIVNLVRDLGYEILQAGIARHLGEPHARLAPPEALLPMHDDLSCICVSQRDEPPTINS